MDKNQLFQNLAGLMNSNKSDFHLILDNLGTLYKKKYKKFLVIKPTDSSAIDGNKPQHFYDSLKLIEDWIQKCISQYAILCLFIYICVF